jgi:hypothetical protein
MDWDRPSGRQPFRFTGEEDFPPRPELVTTDSSLRRLSWTCSRLVTA